MIKHISHQIFNLFICYSLTLSPIIRAEQLALPASDLIAPQITQGKYQDTVKQNENHTITVSVKDNVAVKQVTLYYRVIGSQKYKSQIMSNKVNSDDYMMTINAEEISPPGIEYYIQATDNAGNSLLHGYSFSPLSVKTIVGSATVVAETNATTKPSEDDDSIFNNKWFWIGVGVVALGAAASGGGSSGGGGGTPTADLLITTDEPVQN